MDQRYGIVIFLFLLIDFIILTREFTDIIEYSGYSPENLNNDTKTCFESPANCTQTCSLNDLCIAIAARNETARCDLFLLLYYGRVILKRNPNYTTWVKGTIICFHLLF